MENQTILLLHQKFKIKPITKVSTKQPYNTIIQTYLKKLTKKSIN